jgi:predicted amidohydrolase YtcJ
MRISFLILAVLVRLLPVAAQSGSSSSADLILINGKIWTGANQHEFVEAVAIRGNKILQTGTSAAIEKLAGKSTQLIDLKGKLVTAGINDAHVHFLHGSLVLTGVDLYGCKTLDEAISTIEKFAADHPEKKWITGMGWITPLKTGPCIWMPMTVIAFG